MCCSVTTVWGGKGKRDISQVEQGEQADAGCGGCEKEKCEERWPQTPGPAQRRHCSLRWGGPGKQRPDRENPVLSRVNRDTCPHPLDRSTSQRSGTRSDSGVINTQLLF